jgi:hypothetical protein
MLFLELIHFILNVIYVAYRKRILKSASGTTPGLAEILKSWKQKKISATLSN